MSIAFLALVGLLPFWVSLSGSYPAFSLIYLVALSILCGWTIGNGHWRLRISYPVLALVLVVLAQALRAPVWDHSSGILLTWFLAFLLYLLTRALSSVDLALPPKVAILFWIAASLIAALNPAWQTSNEVLEEALKGAMMEESYKQAILHAALQKRFLFPFGNPIHLGLFLTFSLLAFPYLYSLTSTQDRPMLWRIALVVTGMVQLYVLWGTRARTALLGLLVGAAVTFLFWKRLNARMIVTALVVALLSLGILIVSPAGREMISRVETVQARAVFWGVALRMIHDRPLLGWGVGGFGDYYTQYRPLTPHQTEFPHQLILEVMTDWGVLGVILFLTVFGERLFRFVQRNLRPGASRDLLLQAWRGALLAAFLLSTQLDFSHNKIYLIGIVAVVLGLNSSNPAPTSKIKWTKPLDRRIGIGCLILVTLPFAFRELGHAHFEKGKSLFEQGEDRRDVYERIRLAGEIWPPLWEAHYFAGRMLWDSGERLRGKQALERALEWNPTTAFLHEDLARLLWEEGDRERALGEIRTAIELHPVKSRYHKTLSGWLHQLGEKEQAAREKALAEKLETLEPDYAAEVKKIRESRKGQ